MSNNPLVSVIVPVYNQELFLRDTLNSICGQTYSNLEIILVDDGSTDSTPAILEEYAARDKRIRLLHQQQKYAGCARNYGMSEAKGKYYSLLDSDDLFEPDMIECMVARAEKSGADIVVCPSDIFNNPEERRPMPWQIKKHLLKGVNLELFTPLQDIPDSVFQFLMGWSWDKLYRADFVKEFQLTFAATRHGNDGPFVFPSLVVARTVSVLDERPMVHYRLSDSQLSSSGGLSSAPAACLDSVKEIYSKIKPYDGCAAMMNSFYRWAAEYIMWNATRVCGESRARLFSVIREQFEPVHRMAEKFAAWREGGQLAQYGEAVDKCCAAYESAVAPLISVVLPIYNAEAFLREALDSVVNQTVRNIEIICVNDGSKDNSLEIIKAYERKDSRIRYIDVPNGGYGKAMNLGLHAARGKYFAILEPDDYLPPNAYEILINLAQKNNLDIVRGKFCRFHTDEQGKRQIKEEADYAFSGKVVRPRDYHVLFYNMSLATWTCLYDMAFLKEHDISYHESPGASYQDTGFFMQTFGYAERAMFTNETVYMYRTDNAASSTNTKSGKPYAMLNEFAFIKDRYLHRPERWQNLQEHYLMRRMAAHRWMYRSIPESMVADYLLSFRKELLELKNVSRARFIPVDVQHYEQISISPEHFLRNAGKFPGSERVLLKLTSPFLGAKYSPYPAEYPQDTPAVSVIVPVYSGMERFALMIAVLRSQTLRNIEIIFIDDCGEDGSFALAELAAQDDPRVKLLRNEKNCGPGPSRNKGIAAATGEYVAFVDADDIIPADYYEKLYDTALKTKAKVVKCARVNKYEDGRIEPSSMNQMIREKLAKGEHILNSFGWEHTTAIYHREHVLSNGARNSDALQDEDTTFLMMTLYNLNNEDLVVIDEPCYYYRMHDASVTHVIDSSYLFEAAKSLRDKLDIILSLPPSPHLEVYAANQIEGRLTWRYMRGLNSSLITDEERKNYVEQVSRLISAYQQKRPKHKMYGFSKKLASGEMTVSEYMTLQNNTKMKTTPSTVTPVASPAVPTKLLDEIKQINEEMKRIKTHVAFLCDYGKYRRRYRYHRFLSWFTLGKSRQKHKEQMVKLKSVMRQYKTIIQAHSVL